MRKLRVAVLVVGVVLVMGLGVVIWFAVSGGNWRWGVEVLDAYLIEPDVVEFTVSSCLQQAAVSRLVETTSQVRIKVTHQIALFNGGLECAEIIYCRLEEPLGSRTVIDLHTGDRVSVDREATQRAIPYWPELRDSLNPCV